MKLVNNWRKWFGKDRLFFVGPPFKKAFLQLFSMSIASPVATLRQWQNGHILLLLTASMSNSKYVEFSHQCENFILKRLKVQIYLIFFTWEGSTLSLIPNVKGELLTCLQIEQNPDAQGAICCSFLVNADLGFFTISTTWEKWKTKQSQKTPPGRSTVGKKSCLFQKLKWLKRQWINCTFVMREKCIPCEGKSCWNR